MDAIDSVHRPQRAARILGVVGTCCVVPMMASIAAVPVLFALAMFFDLGGDLRMWLDLSLLFSAFSFVPLAVANGVFYRTLRLAVGGRLFMATAVVLNTVLHAMGLFLLLAANERLF